jgi:hypothetical protein
MAYTKIVNLNEQMVQVFNPSAGSASGSNAYITAPFRAQVTEGGFTPQGTIASNMTIAMAIVKSISSTASVVSEIAASNVAGVFSSLMLVPGQIASVLVPSPSYVDAGDLVRLTTSGGNGVTLGATVYTIFKKA